MQPNRTILAPTPIFTQTLQPELHPTPTLDPQLPERNPKMENLTSLKMLSSSIIDGN